MSIKFDLVKSPQDVTPLTMVKLSNVSTAVSSCNASKTFV